MQIFFFIIYDLLRSQFYLSIFKLLILIYSGDKKLINKTKNDTNLKANTKLSFFALKKNQIFLLLILCSFHASYGTGTDIFKLTFKISSKQQPLNEFR